MSANHSMELLEIKNLLLEQRALLDALFPNKISISFVVERTGLSRQGVRKKLIENYDIEDDFWKENGKIFMTKKVALQMLNINIRGV
jgi:hypothetical protein